MNELAAVAASAAEGRGYAARNGNQRTPVTCPEHAFESVTTADAVFVIVVIARDVVFTPDRTAFDWARQGGVRRSGRFIPAPPK